MDEQGCIDGVIIHREDMIDENEVVVEHIENKTKSGHSKNISRYNPSIDLPIALTKGTRSCRKHTSSLIMCHMRISHHSSELLLQVLTLPQYPKVSTLP